MTASVVLQAVIAIVLVSTSLSCVDPATPPSRSTRSRLSDSSRVTGTGAGTDSTRGGVDMPGKGRAGEHYGHSTPRR
ncbi:MAG TPA: hypothetical protein VGL81_00370 [Polyangiaceae bacterium]|jgi:hypothetical protein